MLGFMLPSWFLSMWISNTATTAMMLPMVEAVLGELEGGEKNVDPEKQVVAVDADGNETVALKKRDSPPPDYEDINKNGGTATVVVVPEEGPNGTVVNKEITVIEEMTPEQEKEAKYFNNLAVGMTLSVAYAANVGGTGTLTGTTPNLIMKGFVDEIWLEKGQGCISSPINFASWMVLGAPLSLVITILIWLWMWAIYIGCERPRKRGARISPEEEKARQYKLQKEARVKAVIEKQAATIKPWSFAEVVVLILFIAMIFLFFFRDPSFMTGWSSGFPNGKTFVGDAVPALFIACIMFVIPSSVPKKCMFTNNKPPDMILDWETFERKMPWGTLLLVGGGFALAEATTRSGLSEWLGDKLIVFGTLPGWAMVLIICFLVTLLTNVTSNSATCTLLMPIMASMAEGIGKSPLYLMLPVAISTSLAFMLPVATPPNAIAFSYGRLRVVDMCKAGAFINVFGVILLTIATHTWAEAYFKFDDVPWPTGNLTGVTICPPGANSLNQAMSLAGTWD